MHLLMLLENKREINLNKLDPPKIKKKKINVMKVTGILKKKKNGKGFTEERLEK